MRFPARRVLTPSRVLIASLTLLLVHALHPGVASAFAQVCHGITVAGRDILTAQDASSAIVISSDGPVTVTGHSDFPIEHVDLDLLLGPFPIVPLHHTPPQTTDWSEPLNVADYASLGVGLYELRGSIDACQVHLWINVRSDSPLTTVASIAALVAMGIGITATSAGLLAGVRRGRGRLRAVIGGALIGGGALVVAQQSGIVPADTGNIISWTTVPGALGGVGHFLLAGVIVPRRRARGSAADGEVPEPEPDAPRESYAHIECPETVVAEQEFELEVGLASVPDSEVVGGPLRRPDSSVGSYTITIQVIADGFHLTRPTDRWRVDLPVTAAAPYPQFVLHLAADPQTKPVVARTVRAMFSVDGQAIGLAARPVAVVATSELVTVSSARAATEPVDILLPTDSTPPDLTVRIELSQPAGRLLCQLLAADPSVSLPTEPLVLEIGSEPASFLRGVIRQMNMAEGQPGMYRALVGIGLTIADQLPTEFWEVVAAVGARTGGRPPTILFLSEEPYIPWELAVMEHPLDASVPPFLSAQASVGRWVLGQRRPKLPPPSTLAVHSMAVVSGIYALPGWERLLDAEQEAADLTKTYGATAVNATSVDVLRLVGGNPPAELLHFAVHGQYDPNGEIDGIVLVDGLTLDPMEIRGSPLSLRPFVFLNACQVGSGNAVLGDYAGVAEAFLFAGASGVIAPLWSIDDITAREIALRFYKEALQGKSPADILREERAAFRDDPSTVSSTYLAYQFFGHPHMTLTGSLK